MKKIILIVACLFIFLCSKGQNVTFDQLITLRTKPLAEVEEFLTLKGWKFTEIEKPNDTTYGMASFYYQGSKPNGESDSRLTYFYSSHGLIYNKVSMWVYNLASYNNIIGRIKGLNFKLESTDVLDNTIVNTYYNGKYIIRAKIYPVKENVGSKTCVFLIRIPNLGEFN